MSTAYGYKVENEDDGYITKLEAFNKTLGDSMSPTSSIINVFPIRECHPLCSGSMVAW